MISVIFQLVLLLSALRPSYQGCKLFKDQSFLTCDEIKTILDYHNECRDLIAEGKGEGKAKLPAAKDMWALKWDKDLAIVAQNYANKCIFEHNKGRPEGTGENLSWKAKSEKQLVDVKHLVEMWYNEIKDYEMGPVDGSHHETGHFTQLVWADTKFVGCGIAFYDDGTKPSTPYQTLLVCDYRPAGNVIGKPPYEEFKDTRCSRGVVSQKFPNLCAHDEDHAKGNYEPCSGGSKLRPRLFIFIASCYMAVIMFCKQG